jgi:hypothetical protein
VKRKRQFTIEIKRDVADDMYQVRIRILVNGEMVFHWYARFPWHHQQDIEREFASFVENPDLPVTHYDVARFHAKLRVELRPAWLADRYELFRKQRKSK